MSTMSVLDSPVRSTLPRRSMLCDFPRKRVRHDVGDSKPRGTRCRSRRLSSASQRVRLIRGYDLGNGDPERMLCCFSVSTFGQQAICVACNNPYTCFVGPLFYILALPCLALTSMLYRLSVSTRILVMLARSSLDCLVECADDSEDEDEVGWSPPVLPALSGVRTSRGDTLPLPCYRWLTSCTCCW
jgi:hypothetical protein